MDDGGFVDTNGGGEVGVDCSLGRFVIVGGIWVADGDAVGDAVGVPDGVTVGEKVRVKTEVAEGVDVIVDVGEWVADPSIVLVGVTEPFPVFGIMKSGP